MAVGSDQDINPPLRFGVLTTAQLGPWAAAVEEAQLIEGLGFDSLWLADQLLIPRLPTLPFLDGWTLLPALAAHTTRIRLGTLVTNVALRNPAVLAKQALTVDHVSDGRLNLGLGPGFYEEEHRMIGIDFLSPTGRVARFREAVELLDRALQGGEIAYEGAFFQIRALPIYPLPVQRPRPPLTLAANGPATLKIAARYADTWNSFGGVGLTAAESLAMTRQRNEQLDQHCAALGREPSTIVRSFLAGFANEAPFASLEDFHDFAGRYRSVGITEFIVYGLSDAVRSQPIAGGPPGRMADRAMLEQVALEALPALRRPTPTNSPPENSTFGSHPPASPGG